MITIKIEFMYRLLLHQILKMKGMWPFYYGRNSLVEEISSTMAQRLFISMQITMQRECLKDVHDRWTAVEWLIINHSSNKVKLSSSILKTWRVLIGPNFDHPISDGYSSISNLRLTQLMSTYSRILLHIYTLIGP